MSDDNPITGLKDTSFDLTRKASVVVRILEDCLHERTQRGRNDWQAIATAHGWPHVRQMRDHIDALRPLGDLPVTFDIDPTHHRPAKEPTMQPSPDQTPPAPRTFDCPDCGATYKQRSSRNQHRLIVHVAVRPGGRAAS